MLPSLVLVPGITDVAPSVEVDAAAVPDSVTAASSLLESSLGQAVSATPRTKAAAPRYGAGSVTSVVPQCGQLLVEANT